MHLTYIELIGIKYPNIQVSCFGDPNLYSSIIWENSAPIPEADLSTALTTYITDASWNWIKEERDRRKAGGVKVGAFWFHSDDPSRIQQIALVMLGPNIPAGLQWKTMTGQFTTMTQSLASQVFQTSIGSDQTIFAKAEWHKQQMLASSKPETYDFSGGWPITYAESPEYVG
jgi:hypothetical protein